ncbi:MAG: CRISPR-associated helicase Cas3' [Alphaproteobacteria bacterium]|nr:CRISPR-associated helicase Cas3' [Alphaproteobacteria bacterium]
MTERTPWGKFSEGDSHHLAHHCADVAACFEEITASTVVRRRLEKTAGATLSRTTLARLAVVAFLHDCGKLHPGFQAKGWPHGPWSARLHGHVAEGAAIFTEAPLEPIARNLQLESLIGWGVDQNLMWAAIAHHGRPVGELPPRAKAGWEPFPDCVYDPVAASAAIGKMVRTWFPEAFTEGGEALPREPNFAHLFNGLVSLADWLGSTRDIFTFVPDLDDGYADRARELAEKAVKDIGLNVGHWRMAAKGRTDFGTLTDGRTPRPQQRLIDDFPLADQLLILEAETGSGKTEAALWRFVRLFEAGQVDGLYFALPTRSAAVQLHRRVNDAMQRVFGPGAPEVVLVVPGYLRAGEAKGQRLPEWKVKWDDDNGKDEQILLSRWAAESTKRALAATVAVGTVDQAMLAALQVKHAHLRAGALSRNLLVIDEVHASDHYMTEVQDNLLRTHLDRGGHAMLMSATLGSIARAKWLRRRLPTFREATDTPYPALWGSCSAGPRSVADAPEKKTVSVSLVPTMAADKAAALAIDAARDGARVLVIRNTVSGAIDCFRAVVASGGADFLMQLNDQPALHHGRFAPEDRKLLDGSVEEALCPKRTAASGKIVIGTQTLEQSLDIDADWLLTDLCPADVLLQRIGRLHRHAECLRPTTFARAQCRIMVPEDGLAELLEPRFIHGLGAWESPHGRVGIYRDVSGLELTRRLVAKNPVWEIPAENRSLVESATHPEQVEALHQELGKEWADYWNAIRGTDMAESGAARTSVLQVDNPFAGLKFPDRNEQYIRTRLGAEGARIVFSNPVPGPFGAEISRLTLPSHWCHDLGDIPEVVPEKAPGGLFLRIGHRQFFYDRHGLTKIQTLPSKFAHQD